MTRTRPLLVGLVGALVITAGVFMGLHAQDPIVFPPVGRPIPALIYPVAPSTVIAPATRARLTGQTGAVANIWQVTPTSDTTYFLSANVNLAAACTCSFNVIVNYTDEANNAKTWVEVFQNNGGALVSNPAITAGPNVFQGLVSQIRAKGGTTVTATTAGTFTSVTYNVEVIAQQCLVCP